MPHTRWWHSSLLYINLSSRDFFFFFFSSFFDTKEASPYNQFVEMEWNKTIIDSVPKKPCTEEERLCLEELSASLCALWQATGRVVKTLLEGASGGAAPLPQHPQAPCLYRAHRSRAGKSVFSSLVFQKQYAVHDSSSCLTVCLRKIISQSQMRDAQNRAEASPR